MVVWYSSARPLSRSCLACSDPAAPAYAAYERNRLSLYREAAKEAESIIDRWEDELDDDEDYEPDEYFSD